MTSNNLSETRSQWINPLWLIVPTSVITFALGWSNVGGAIGALFGGIGGFVWVLVLGYIVRRTQRNQVLHNRLANATALAAGVTLFTMMGGGLYETLLFDRALDVSPEWITTLTQGPLAEQVILYFVVFNSLMEIFFVPLAVLLNWHFPKRRVFVLAAAAIFYAIRIWTYLYFAPEYFDFGEMAFSQAFLDLLSRRMMWDNLRFVVMTGEAILFLLVALVPIRTAYLPIRKVPAS